MSARLDYNALVVLVPALVVIGVGVYLADREIVAIGAGVLGGVTIFDRGNTKE